MLTNIVNNYIGDSSVSRVYQGDNLIYDQNHPDILCEYLQAGEDSSAQVRGNVWFDTGINPQTGYGVEIRWKLPVNNPAATSGEYEGVLLGMSQTANTGASFSGDWYFMSPSTSNSGKMCRYRNMSNVVDTHDIDTNVRTVCVTCSGTSQTIKVSNGLSTTATASSSKSFEVHAYIFGLKTYTSYSTLALSGTRIYYIKIITSNNQRLVRFYVPVLHWDGTKYVPCFLDKVNNTYIYNQGTGTVYYKIKNDYVLDWIGTSDTAGGSSPQVWYNTGVNIKTYMTHHLGFINGGTGEIAENYIVGTRKSSTIKYGVFCPLDAANTVAFATSTTSSNFVILDASSNLNIPDKSYIVTASHYDSSSKKQIHIRELASSPIVNGLFGESAASSETASSIYGKPLGIFGINADDGARTNNRAGTKLRYLCTGDSVVNPTAVYNFIPVLHNGVPAFHDIKNNTYKYNEGTDTPAIKFQK